MSFENVYILLTIITTYKIYITFLIAYHTNILSSTFYFHNLTYKFYDLKYLFNLKKIGNVTFLLIAIAILASITALQILGNLVMGRSVNIHGD